MKVKSQYSEPNSKSRFFHLPLLLAIAHILNFAVRSPLSTWIQFPSKLPESVYVATFITPLLLFILLTFEPIQTRKRFYTLLSLTLIYISIPLRFRTGKYPQNALVA